MQIISGGFDSPTEASRRFTRAYVGRWLADLRRYHRHYAWMSRHAGELRQVIRSGLYLNGLYEQSMEGLYLSAWYAFALKSFAAWKDLAQDALNGAMDLKDSLHLQRAFAVLGYGYKLDGKFSAARQAFHQARDYTADGCARHDRRAQETLLYVYTGLLKLETYQYSGECTPEVIDEALLLAQTLGDPDMTARLEQALASFYLIIGEPHRAVDCGAPALGYWRKHNNHLEIARTALPLTRACWELKDARLMQHFQDVACVYAAKAPQTYMSALVQYEQGLIYMAGARYDRAIETLNKAMDVFDTLELPYHITMTRHSLGLAHLYTGLYGEARWLLEAGMDGWRKLGNRYEAANCHHALGYLYAKRGSEQRARALLTQGLQLCAELPQTTARNELEQLIRKTLDELDRNVFASQTA